MEYIHVLEWSLVSVWDYLLVEEKVEKFVQ